MPSRMCPPWAPDEVKALWKTWPDSYQAQWLSRNRSGQPVVMPTGATAAQAAPATAAKTDYVSTLVAKAEETAPVITDLRLWNEVIDGIPAERIRNCIIFQLDYKKDHWYRDNLTERYLRRMLKLGITGARKLHEDTPPGWAPPEKDPMIAVKTQEFDGETIERSEIVRGAKTQAERDTLLNLLVDRYGRRNPNIVKWLADKNCPQCKGRGIYLVRTSNEKGLKFQADQWYDCDCVTRKEFKA